jgi:hypothetical protein
MIAQVKMMLTTIPPPQSLEDLVSDTIELYAAEPTRLGPILQACMDPETRRPSCLLPYGIFADRVVGRGLQNLRQCFSSWRRVPQMHPKRHSISTCHEYLFLLSVVDVTASKSMTPGQSIQYLGEGLWTGSSST